MKFTLAIMTAINLVAFFSLALEGLPLYGLFMIGLCLASYWAGSNEQIQHYRKDFNAHERNFRR